MSELKYKVGDKVLIKSIDWYNKNKDANGDVLCFYGVHKFTKEMSKFCNKTVTISTNLTGDGEYLIKDDDETNWWTDEMIEGLVEEETLIERVDDKGLPFNEWLSHKGAFHIPDGYELKDENGNIINATKIVLEKKEKEYPKTYEECCKVLGVSEFEYNHTGTKMWYRHKLMATLDNLMLCRDAYWKIAGEEMGLGKPWEPDWTDNNAKYSIYTIKGELTKATSCYDGAIFTFPTAEMRDAFYENFKELIESCKELL